MVGALQAKFPLAMPVKHGESTLTICILICIILCKMTRERKSRSEAEAIGFHLQQARKACGYTLEDVQNRTGVNVGQLSRFEAGQFTFITDNLQKFMNLLQESNVPVERHPQLVQRFAALLDRSPQHKVAATALIAALECLQ
jgi:hypothetical protein